VQGDDEQETAEGYQLLLSLGLAPRMSPKCLTDGRWMARAVPAPARKVPAGEPTA
jgi:hypothetical protein